MVHFVFFHYLPVSSLSFPGTTRQRSKKNTEKKNNQELTKNAEKQIAKKKRGGGSKPMP